MLTFIRFWKRPFLLCLARVRCLPRHEAFPDILEHYLFRAVAYLPLGQIGQKKFFWHCKKIGKLGLALLHFTLASHKLQRIQNSLARVITNTSKCQHITPILKKLHWFPITQRIDYKLCLLTYKTLTNQQPTYLYNSLSFPSHSASTRSSDSLVLSIPYVRSSLGKRVSQSSVHGSGIHSLLISDVSLK